MISEEIKKRYTIRNNPIEGLAESERIIKELTQKAYGEGIIGNMVEGTARGVGKAAMWTGKKVGGFGYNVAKAGAKGTGKLIDNTVLSNSVGEELKYKREKLKTMFKTILKQIMKMIDNLTQSLFGYEKRLQNMVKEIDQGLAKRHPNGANVPKKIKMITPEGLNTIGLDVTQEGSRASIANGYLATVTQQSLLEGIHFGDEVSEKRSMEELIKRITGQSRPYDQITPEFFKQAVEDNLYLFNEMNDKVEKKSGGKWRKGGKDFFKGAFGAKQAASVDSARIDQARRDVMGDEAITQAEAAIKIIRNSAMVFVNLHAIEFLKKEQSHLDTIGDEIDKLLDKKMSEDQSQNRQQAYKQSSTQDTRQQSSTNNSQQQSNDQQASGQSYVDTSLLKAIYKAGYGEVQQPLDNPVGQDAPDVEPGQNYNKEQYPTLDEMSKDHELMQTFLISYSQVLNNTLQNIGRLYEALLMAGKSCMTTYYSLSK